MSCPGHKRFDEVGRSINEELGAVERGSTDHTHVPVARDDVLLYIRVFKDISTYACSKTSLATERAPNAETSAA